MDHTNSERSETSQIGPDTPTLPAEPLDSSLLLPMRQYVGCGLTATFNEQGSIHISTERDGLLRPKVELNKHVMRQLIEFHALGLQVLELRKSTSEARPAPSALPTKASLNMQAYAVESILSVLSKETREMMPDTIKWAERAVKTLRSLN